MHGLSSVVFTRLMITITIMVLLQDYFNLRQNHLSVICLLKSRFLWSSQVI
jgi:hypothetical protein